MKNILFIVLMVALLVVGSLFLLRSNQDFSQEEEVFQIEEQKVVTEKNVPSENNQLYLTIMTHMEQGFSDDTNRNMFLDHVEQVRYGMSLADEVGAVLNIESEQPFALANTIWGVPIMEEILKSGHGVQTHCDLGSINTSHEMSAKQYSLAFAENKKLVDELVGEENNLGCSGGGGINDWALAASLAGFKYLNGIVGGHLLAVPYENRPSEKWTDEYIQNEGWHAAIPENVYESIYPIPLADNEDIKPDEDPVIIMMPGSLGRIDYFAEDDDSKCSQEQNCDFTLEDIDAMLESIQDVAERYDVARGVAKMTVYVPSKLYVESNEPVLEYFFSEIGRLEDEGVFHFGTHKEIYESYVEQMGFQL